MPDLRPIALAGLVAPAQAIHNMNPMFSASELAVLDPNSERHLLGTPRTALNGKTAAVAAGNSVTVQPATASIKLHVLSLVITCSAANEIQIIDNATIVCYYQAQVGVPFQWVLPVVGYCQQALNTALTIKNNGGVATDIIFACLGNLLQ